ncbi:MAG: hypothetical protein QM638_10655 [Nocardioides sp.]|uniref:hypothetical protein n=1 Tax=Nocardioides sp. TaxID=35761 RepID=UPI0039E53A0A
MSSTQSDTFDGYEHNPYQHTMHTAATVTLWTIVVLGVACGIFGFIWGLAH